MNRHFSFIFENENIEIVEINGKVLFNAKDVGMCLDIAEVRSSIRGFTESQKIIVTNSDVQSMHFRKLNNAGELFLTESGIYRLIFKSRKEEAKRFEKWVTEKVLPSIRQNDFYIDDNINQENLDKLNKAVQEINRMRGLLVDTTGYSGNDYIRLDIIAKEWGDKEGVNINELALVELMRKHRWIDKEGNLYDKIKYGGKVICTKERYFLSPRGSELLWVHFLKESHSNLLEWSNNIKTEKPF